MTKQTYYAMDTSMLLTTLLQLVDRVKTMTENALHFDEETSQLKQRIEILQVHLRKIEAKEHEDIVADDLIHIKETFEEVEHFLTSLNKQSANRVSQNRDQYKQDFDHLNEMINEDFTQLALNLNADLPVDQWDKEKEAYPPLLHQLPTVQVEKSEENDDCLAWDTNPAAPPVNAGSSSNSLRSPRDRQEMYQKIRELRRWSPSTRITKISVVMARLEDGDTSPKIMAAQTAAGVVGGTLGVVAGVSAAALVTPIAVVGDSYEALMKKEKKSKLLKYTYKEAVK